MSLEPTRTLTVTLPRAEAERLEAAVDEGAYASASELIRDAFRLWERDLGERLESARLKRAYDEGMASGEGRRIDADALLRAARAQAARG